MAGAAWTVESRWKEELWYREGTDEFCFDCGWDAAPYVAYVPSPRSWDRVVPPFLQGRRDEVLARIRAANDRHGHVLEDTEVGYRPWRPAGTGSVGSKRPKARE